MPRVEKCSSHTIDVARVIISENRENLTASNALTELKIWDETSIPGGLSAWDLNPFFKRNLKIAWMGG